MGELQNRKFQRFWRTDGLYSGKLTLMSLFRPVFFFFSIFTGFDMLKDADSGYKNNAIVTVYLYSLY